MFTKYFPICAKIYVFFIEKDLIQLRKGGNLFFFKEMYANSITLSILDSFSVKKTRFVS